MRRNGQFTYASTHTTDAIEYILTTVRDVARFGYRYGSQKVTLIINFYCYVVITSNKTVML